MYNQELPDLPHPHRPGHQHCLVQAQVSICQDSHLPAQPLPGAKFGIVTLSHVSNGRSCPLFDGRSTFDLDHERVMLT